LARSALGVVRAGNPAPEPLGVAMRDLALATEALAAYLETPESPEEARRLALKSATGAAALLREREDLAKDMATNAFIDDVFSTAYDLAEHRHGPGGGLASPGGGHGTSLGAGRGCDRQRFTRHALARASGFDRRILQQVLVLDSFSGSHAG
jgi:hypothetical protein